MLRTNTKTLAKLLNINCVTNVEFSGIYTNTRQPMRGGVFLALIGDNFDAHDYVKKAEEMGAVAIISSKSVSTTLPILMVENTQQALSDIAKYHLNQINPTTIAITGSNGKTTTKNLLANILNLSAPTLKTQGNLNNHLGVPMTLLKLESHHQYAVIEMGANHLGEIEYLRDIVNPDIAIVTNTGDAHIGEFGGLDNLIKAKGEIYSEQSLNIVDAQSNFKGDLSFGEQGDIFASQINGASFDLHIKQDSIRVNLQLLGTHNIDNALAASACAHALNIGIQTIKTGLESTQAESGRLSIIHTKSLTLIDDTYNASPSSIKAALVALQTFKLEPVIVLGSMAELGNQTKQLHQQIGRLAKAITPNFYTFGELAKHYGGIHFDTQSALSEHLLKNHPSTVILIKGSRIAQLDKLIKILKNKAL
jgi:UDP-N-acetylmuramoyl-tripeptide--D-alanyl-D-alanine ligase